MRVTALYIDAQVADWPETRSICSRFDVPVKTAANVDEVLQIVVRGRRAGPGPAGKQVLYLTRNKG